MAANPIVVVDHGKVEIPAELLEDPRFRNGARLQLVPVVTVTDPSEVEATSAWKTFRSLRGILATSSFDPNAELEKEKQRELEAEQ